LSFQNRKAEITLSQIKRNPHPVTAHNLSYQFSPAHFPAWDPCRIFFKL